jgi:hypothetical protein
MHKKPLTAARNVSFGFIAILGLTLALCNSTIAMSLPSEIMVCMICGLLVYLLVAQVLVRKYADQDDEILSMLFSDAHGTE